MEKGLAKPLFLQFDLPRVVGLDLLGKLPHDREGSPVKNLLTFYEVTVDYPNLKLEFD